MLRCPVYSARFGAICSATWLDIHGGMVVLNVELTDLTP